MISRIKKVWNRILVNDYAFFIIISLVFAIVSSLVDSLLLRLDIFADTDGLSFSELWVVGFFVAFAVHWQKSKKKFKS